MKTVICYASKTGTAKECAEKLKALLKDAVLCDIEKDKATLSEYDCIVVGGSIRMGKLHKATMEFIAKNKEIMKQKKYAFFICNGFPEQAESFLIQNIGQELLEDALCAASFGGKLELDKLKGMDKFIAKAVVNSTKGDESALPKIQEDSIKEFAAVLNEQ